MFSSLETSQVQPNEDILNLRNGHTNLSSTYSYLKTNSNVFKQQTKHQKTMLVDKQLTKILSM